MADAGSRKPSPPVRDFGSLPTEARNPISDGLDTLESEAVVELLVREDQKGLDGVIRCKSEIAEAADWCARSLGAGGSVVFVGAGTSGRLGILEAAECPPTFGTDAAQIRAIIAGGEDAIFRAREGAEDVFEDGAAAVESVGSSDVVIGLSASSATPFVRGALKAGGVRGARTVLVTCAGPDLLEGVADLIIALDTGAEILSGSTRLKAGSATKAALNAITTAAMVRLGKVYRNLMVDLRPGSAKLVDRSLRIVQAACDVGREEAQRLIGEADGDVKTAIVMGLCGLNPGPARDRLRLANGQVRRAVCIREETEKSGSV